MGMQCKEAISLMHDYLDGDLHGAPLVDLNKHIIACDSCRTRLKQLEQTEAMIQYVSKTAVPDGLTERIMLALPRPKKQKSWMQWVKRHPAISVAAMFVIVMMSSFFSLWNQDTDLVVKGADLEEVVIEGDTVYVPRGHSINGDLVVENGKLKVDGRVNGNLVVIDGSVQLASTAYISGEVTRVNQAVDWIWYKINELFSLISK